MRLWETPVPIPNTTVKTQAADGTALETMWESRWAPDYGDVAQLGEHLPCKQGVKGSNPSISIRMQKHRILLCTLKIAYRKYKISLTQKIQDIREKTKNVCEHKRT